jgi:hypothetical protein
MPGALEPMDTTPNLALPYLIAAQAQKHVTHNEAIRMLDALVQLAVLDRQIDMPPASPANGDRYIVGSSPTGAWVGKANEIAAFQDGAWAFFAPQNGWIAWVSAEDALYAWDGASWVAAGGGSLNPAPLVGVNATADATNRLSVSSPATLLNHEGAGHQLKVNKATSGDTASLLFQDGFSGRAEMGLAGDDDFHVKVSADGSAWTDAVSIDRSTGHVAMPRQSAIEELHDLGTIVSGTLTPDPAHGHFQTYQNAGAHTLAAPSAAGSYRLTIAMRNALAAGPVTIDGFDIVSGDENLTATAGDAFWLDITRIAEISRIAIEAVGGTPSIPLILIFGESNAGGSADNADLTVAELAPRAVVQILDNTSLAFANLDIGTNNLIDHDGFTDNATHGMENGLANTIGAGRWTTASAYLVKAGQGGTTTADWLEPDNTNWLRLVTRVNAAKSILDGGSISYAPLVIYTHGLNDIAGSVPTATTKANMIQLISDVRGLLGATTPVVVTRLPSGVGAALNAAIDEIAAADPDTTTLDGSDLDLFDANHWNAMGFRRMMERLADDRFGAAGTLTAPSMSPPPGTYGSAQSVSLTAAPGAAIYYTTDGSTPTTHAALYSAPIDVSASLSVSAIAVSAGWRNSAVASGAYTISGASWLTWTSMAHASQSGDYLVNDGSVSGGSGGLATATIDSTQPFSIVVDYPADTVETNGVVVTIDDENSASYDWSGTVTYIGGVFQTSGSFFRTTSNSVAVAIGTFAAGLFRMRKSGDDLVYENSTDAGASWTPLYTATGALAGLTTLYVKAIFAVVNTPASQVRVRLDL